MKTCLGCKYAEWNRTKTGALHPSGDGRCTFPWKMPPLPASMYFVGWMDGDTPSGGCINRRKELYAHCPYFNRESPEVLCRKHGGRAVKESE